MKDEFIKFSARSRGTDTKARERGRARRKRLQHSGNRMDEPAEQEKKIKKSEAVSLASDRIRR